MNTKNYLFKDSINSLLCCLLLSNFVYFLQGMYICLHTPLYIGGVDSRQPNILYTVDNTLNKQNGAPPPVIVNYSV